MDYILVIPTHRRATILLEKTWALLQRTAPNIKPIIWVNDDQDYQDYKPLFPTAEIRIGGSRLAEKRNLIQHSYPLDTKIVMIDDDIKDLVIKDGNKKKPIKDLDALIKLGFSYCEKEGCSMWGVYPLDNPLSMTNYVRKNLCYIIACFFGMINKRIDINLDCVEDYERSIKFWLLEKKLIRMEFVGIKTKPFNPIGGLSYLRKQGRDAIDRKKLVELYPSLCKLQYKKNYDMYDIKLLSKKDVLVVDIPQNI